MQMLVDNALCVTTFFRTYITVHKQWKGNQSILDKPGFGTIFKNMTDNKKKKRVHEGKIEFPIRENNGCFSLNPKTSAGRSDREKKAFHTKNRRFTNKERFHFEEASLSK
ncbi:hypothetical protein CDAR_274101 [Caerostris darwini]|uniref:Uncharacterized protein n=1 Tax=Caerostris darwini TaxID=1538125 RepID=A0AAV4RGZ6_9ARAC|nr:hypothetical protein CDAR_274101 [Caerostris darwini]